MCWGEVPSHHVEASGMYEGKYSESVFREAKINVLVWLVVVQAEAKEEEH